MNLKNNYRPRNKAKIIRMISNLAKLSVLIIVFTTLVAPSQPIVAGAPTAWVTVGPGIDYQEFFVATPYPNRLFVARMDRSKPYLTLESSLAQGRLSGATEKVSDMAKRYDQAINYWGDIGLPHSDGAWGARNQVVVAINGDLFTAPGIPTQGVVHSGWYAKRFTNNQNRSGFGWTLERQPFIGECVQHKQPKQVVTFPSSNQYEFNDINVPRSVIGKMYIYTPQYDATTLTDTSGTEVLVEMERPDLILPLPNMVYGTVRQVLKNQGNTPIPFDHLVLSGTGAAANDLETLKVGDQIGISQEVRSLTADCKTGLNSVDWTKTYSAIGSSFFYLKDWVIQDYSSNPGAMLRTPRTAVAFNDSYIYFIVVDGYDPYFSVGMTVNELAEFTLNVLGAQWATDFDGGHSTTMVINGEVKNFPEKSSGFTPVVYLPLVNRGSTYQVHQSNFMEMQVTPLLPDHAIRPVTVKPENGVANGLMMVVVQPMQQSKRFAVGVPVVAKSPGGCEVRLGPGSNYAIQASRPSGSTGVVIAHSNGLNGVLAKGAYWWHVTLGGTLGWVDEACLDTP